MPWEWSSVGAFFWEQPYPKQPPALHREHLEKFHKSLSINLCEAWRAGAVLTALGGSPHDHMWLFRVLCWADAILG